MRILGLDLGRFTGFGLLGPGVVRSGSHEILKTWSPYPAAILIFEARLQGIIDKHKPDILATARPFVRYGRGGKMIDTTQNLIPMFGAFAILNRLAGTNGLPLDVIQESEARHVMLGKFMPRKSADIKLAILKACAQRGWRATDDHAADALCIAAAALEAREPGQAHQTTPLFTAPTARQRRKKAA